MAKNRTVQGSSSSSIAGMNPVQALLEHRTLRSIPPEYVQPRAIPTSDSVQTPVVDMSQLRGSQSSKQAALKVLDRACREWGAFQVVNHGIPKEVLSGMRNAAQHFYNVPVAEKMKYFVTVFDGRPMRYSTSFDCSRDSVLEWKDVLRIPAEATPSQADQVWPAKEHLPREPVNKYGRCINELATEVLEALNECLGLPTGYLNRTMGSRDRILAVNYYPPCPEPDRALGLGAHSDATAITLLVQNQVDGLQLYHKDRWVTAKLLPDAIQVSLGDQLQILSNGKYHSVEHRAVVNKDKLRISVATLVGPSRSTTIAPAPQLVDKNHPALYRPVVFQDYLLQYMKNGLNTRGALRSIATKENKL